MCCLISIITKNDDFYVINRVRAYGPGVEPTGPVVGAPANFTVETFSAGKGNVEVSVEDPRGQKIPVPLSSLLRNKVHLTHHLLISTG